ncbi:hypothetical protein [Streptomyces sp. NPDC058297]|uniref:hypothetical protein n=1 Tax=Streptomyces sp. NPDC058297 TaxID=3346433 RepID=UPI0036E24E14
MPLIVDPGVQQEAHGAGVDPGCGECLAAGLDRHLGRCHVGHRQSGVPEFVGGLGVDQLTRDRLRRALPTRG